MEREKTSAENTYRKVLVESKKQKDERSPDQKRFSPETHPSRGCAEFTRGKGFGKKRSRPFENDGSSLGHGNKYEEGNS